MTRALLTGIGLLLLSTVPAAQGWDKGFNFRATSGFVTDPADHTYVLASDAYPVTRNGVTFGWTVNPTNCSDRNNAVDARLAGICFGDGVGTFRVDLPSAGDYDIRLAMGDEGSSQTQTRVKVKDNATDVIDIGPHDTVLNFYDATNVSRADIATWVSSNAASSETFATTTLFLTLEDATSNSVITTLFISQTAGGGGGSSRKRRMMMGIGDW